MDKKEISAYFSALGKTGGKKLMEERGKDYFSDMAKKAWAKRKAVDKSETAIQSVA